jgi:hypothetical protein
MASKMSMRRAIAAYSSKPRTFSTIRSKILLEPPSSSSSAAPRSTLLGRRGKSTYTNPEDIPVDTAVVDSQTHLANIALAAALAGFCGFVFTYSMNAVGRADTSKDSSGDDPLAKLKAEAQEARDNRTSQKAQRMTPEEVAALESGMSNRNKGGVEVAVAAPAEIAQLEEEANLKLFQNGDGEAPKKKKPWWRFGF